MQIQPIIKPTKPFVVIAFVAMAFDGFSALAFGGLYLLASLLADPVDFKVETKDAIVAQGTFVAGLTVLYLIVCLLSANYWAKGKTFLGYVLLCLGVMHLVLFSYLFQFRNEAEMLTYIFYGSLLLNVSLLGIAAFTKFEGKFLARSQNP